MKLLFTKLLILAAFVLLCSTAWAQSGGDVTTNPFSPAPYRVGERLTYDVSFAQFVSAAHIELFVAGRGVYLNREGVLLRAHVETTGVVNAALYDVNNDYASYVDPLSGLPFRAQQVVREAGRTSDTASDYNQAAGTTAIPGKLAGNFSGTYDLLSAVYRARALPLAEGASYHFAVQADGEMYEADLKVTGQEMIKTNVGSFKTIVARLNLKGSKVNNYHVQVYFSDDERHVPVLVTARLPAGEIRAELAGSQLPAIATPTESPARPVAVTPKSETTLASPSLGNGLPEGLPFKVGEQLNFQVYLASAAQPVGTASFLIRAHSRYFNRDGLLFTVRAQTTNAAQRMFFANDQISSYVDPATLLPFRTELNLVEGSRRLNRIWAVDQDRGIAIGDKGERTEIPVGTYDLVSVLYAMRSLDLAPPKRNAVSVLINDRPKTLFITSLRRETIDLGGQRVPSVQVSLTTDDPQSDKFQLRGWISADDRRLPLRLTAMTALGALRADLVIIPVRHQ